MSELPSDSELSNSETTVVPKWKSASLADAFNGKDIAKVKETLTTVKASLTTTKELLNTAKSFVSLLSVLEGLLTNPLAGVVKAITSTIRKQLKEIKSSGLYVLNTFEFTSVPREFTVTEDYVTENDQLYKEALQSENYNADFYLNSNREDAAGLELNTSENKFNIDGTTDTSNKKYISKDRYAEGLAKDGFLNIDGTKIDIFPRFLPITYSDYMQKIADAFVDPDDLPDGAIINEVKVDRSVGYKKDDTFKTTTKLQESLTSINNEYIQATLGTAGLNALKFRSGAPQWSDGSYAKVYILTIAVPDFNGFINQVKILLRLLSGFGVNLNGGDLDGVAQSWNDFTKNFNNLKSSPTAGNLADTDTYGQMQAFMQNNASVQSIIPGGTRPDFYGVSLYSLFPLFWNQVENTLNALEGLFDSVDIGIADLIENVIASFERKIKKIENIINVINELVKFIDDLLNLNASLLEITSQKGVWDIYDQLLSAEGFPGQDLDRPMFMGGFVFAYGLPSPKFAPFDSMKLDLNKYFANAYVDVKTEAGQLKVDLEDTKRDSSKSINTLDGIFKKF